MVLAPAQVADSHRIASAPLYLVSSSASCPSVFPVFLLTRQVIVWCVVVVAALLDLWSLVLLGNSRVGLGCLSRTAVGAVAG